MLLAFKQCNFLQVPKKFRYPLHTEIMWYLVKQYVTLLERDQEERNKKPGTSDDVVANGTKGDSEGRPRRSLREKAKSGEENKENLQQKVGFKIKQNILNYISIIFPCYLSYFISRLKSRRTMMDLRW